MLISKKIASLFFFAALIPSFSFAMFEGKKQYRVEGHIAGDKLILQEETRARVDILLEDSPLKKNGYFQVVVEVFEPCSFKCKGKLIKIERELEPYENPKALFPAPTPL